MECGQPKKQPTDSTKRVTEDPTQWSYIWEAKVYQQLKVQQVIVNCLEGGKSQIKWWIQHGEAPIWWGKKNHKGV